MLFFLLAIMPSSFLYAQLCSGSLGDAIVKIDFGNGNNPGQALTQQQTSYTYQSADCPNDGYYTIRNSTGNCFSNSWHTTGDYTQNGNGYMFIVNASYAAGTFYTDTVRSLCSSTFFQFSARMMNLLKPSACSGNGIKPDITFRIERPDGSLIQSYNTGPLIESGVPQWNEYGFSFSTPPGVQTVVLKLINNAAGGCGNDLAIDDISFRPCGPKINAGFVHTTADSFAICSGTNASYTIQGSMNNAYISPAFRWQQWIGNSWEDIASTTTLSYTLNMNASTPPGIYKYRLAAAESNNIASLQCRVTSAPLTLEVLSSPTAHAGPDKVIILGDSTKLLGSISGNQVQYSWSPTTYISNVQLLQPMVSPPATTWYSLKAVSQAGCGFAQDSVLVTVYNDLYIPNAFTPNGDGINDTWNIPMLYHYPQYELMIYNRFGEKVFAYSNTPTAWTGMYKNNPLPSGTYVYVLKIKHKPLRKGTVLLLR